jgi:hypothetical protein
MNGRRLAIAVTALATVAFAGGAYAASQDSTNPRQAFLNDVAGRLHVTPQQLSAALQGAAADQLDAAVKAGRLTQAQADALKQKLQNGELPAPFLFKARPFYGRPSFGLHAPLASVASYLGLTPAQLVDQLSSGKTLAQVAVAHGKTAAGLKQAMLADARSHLNTAVANKMITQAQAQELLSRLSAKLDALMNAHPMFGERAWGPPPPGPGFVPGMPPGTAGSVVPPPPAPGII